MKEEEMRQQGKNIQEGNGATYSLAPLHDERGGQGWEDISAPFGSHITSRISLVTARLRNRIQPLSLNWRLPGLKVWRSDYPGLAISEWAGRIASPVQSLASNLHSKFNKTTIFGRQGSEIHWLTRSEEHRGYRPVERETEYLDESKRSILSENEEIGDDLERPADFSILQDRRRGSGFVGNAIHSTILKMKKPAGEDVGEVGASGIIQSGPHLNIQGSLSSSNYTPPKDISIKKPYLLHNISSPKRANTKKPAGEIGQHMSTLSHAQTQPDIRGQVRPIPADYSYPGDIISAGSKLSGDEGHAMTENQPFLDEYPYHEEVSSSTSTSPIDEMNIKDGAQSLSGKYRVWRGVSQTDLQPEYKMQKELPYDNRYDLPDSLSRKTPVTTVASKIIGRIFGRTNLDSQFTTTSITGERVKIGRTPQVPLARPLLAQKKSPDYLGRLSILPPSIHRVVPDNPVPAIARQHIIDRDADMLSTEGAEPLPLTLSAPVGSSYRSPLSASPSLFASAPSFDRIGRSLYRSSSEDTRAFGKSLEADSETSALTESIPEARQARSISPDQVPDGWGIGDFKQIKRNHVYLPGQSHSTQENTPPMHTLIPGTEWPMTQMVYPKGRASDIRLNTDAFDGTILPQEPGTNGTKPVFLDQRMDESIMNIMPAAEAADVESMEQSQKAEFDIDSFAQKVYWILKRQLVVEKERRGVKF